MGGGVTSISPALAASGGAASVLNFEQCTNGQPPAPNTSCTGWTDGSIQHTNSQYAEDDVTPQRLLLSLPSGSSATQRTVVVTYDAMKGGVHAYDSLATVNHTVVNAVSQRCSGLTASNATACSNTGTTAATLPIPPDPNAEPPATAGGTSVSAHQLTGQVSQLFGGTLDAMLNPAGGPACNMTTGANCYEHSGLGTANDTVTIELSYHVASTPADVQLLFGGHLAASYGGRGWGAGLGSGYVSGSSYHISVTTLDGASSGSHDNQVQGGAILPPNLGLTKTADAASVLAGQNIGFTIGVTNGSSASNGPASNVTLSDPLPAGSGVNWVISPAYSGPGTCGITGSAGSQVLNCNFGNLPGGATVSIHVTSVTSTAGCIAYNNTATASGTNTPTLTASATTTVVCPPIVNIRKTADAAAVNAGDGIGFTVTVSNTGASTATGVQVSDPLPTNAGVSWTIDTANSDAGWSISAGNLAYGPATLAPGASVKVHITSPTTSSTCGTVNNTASVTTTNGGSGQSSATVTVNCPQIAITKTADAATVNAGDTVGFTVTVSNSGPGTAYGVQETDTLPTNAGLSWSIDSANSDAGWSISGGKLLYGSTSTTLAAGASVKVHITSPTTGATGPCPNGTVNNTASASATNGGSAQASASVTVFCAQIVVTKTADAASVSAGDTIGFTVTVANHGTGTAYGVHASDPLPSNAGLSWSIDTANSDAGWTISGGQLVYGGTSTSLASGASVKVHVTSPTTAASCGTVSNTASASTTNDGSSQATASVAVNCAHIVITKTADAGSVNAGDSIGFTVTVSNTGLGTAYGVQAADQLPANSGLSWSIDSANSSAGWSISGGSLLFGSSSTSLAPGASVKVHITSPTTSATCGTVDNTASVTTTNDGGGPASASVTVNCAQVHIVKTADSGIANAGDTIGFTVVVNNSGTGTAYGVQVTDSLPANAGLNWTIDGANSDAGWSISGGKLVYGSLSTTLAPGASTKVHITSPTVAATCGVVSNSASVTSTNDGSGQSGDSVTVNCAQIQITKTADQASVNAGDAIGFVVTVTNTGAGTAYGVLVSDPLPANAGLNWTIDTANSSSGWSIGGGALGYGPASLAAGASVSVHITSSTTSATCGTVNNTASVATTNDGSGQASAAVTVNCAQVQITKTADQASVNATDSIGFTVTVHNTGAGAAYDLQVMDPLPASAGLSWSVDSAHSSSGWTISGGSLSYGPASLAPGASVTVHITSPTSPASCGTVDNTAVFTTTNADSGQAGASVIVNCAQLTITKTADTGTVNAGDSIGFTVTVTNTGAGTAYGVLVSDPLPGNGGLAWSVDGTHSSSGWSIAGGVLGYGPASLGAGGTVHVHVTSPTTSASCGAVDNTATVAASNTAGGESSATVTVNCAQIHITKTADQPTVNAGDEIGFTVTVSNGGSGTAYGVQETDTLPTNAGLSWSIDSGGSDAGWSISGGKLLYGSTTTTLAPGASVKVHVTSPTTGATAPCPNGTVTNTASVTTTNDGSGQATASVTVLCAQVGVTKTADAASVPAGMPIGFTVTISNTGTGTAYGVSLNDPLPAGNSAHPVHWTVDQGSGNPASFALSGADGSQSLALQGQPVALPSGGSLSIHLTAATGSQSCTSYDNTATVSSSNGGGGSASATTAVMCADPSLTKVAGSASVDAGSPISFAINFANGGGSDVGAANGVTLTDPLPSGSGISWSVDSSTTTPNGVTCAISGSAPNQVLNCGSGSDGTGSFTLQPGQSVHAVVASATTAATCAVLSNTASAALPFNSPSTLTASAQSIVRCVTSISSAPSATSGTVGIAVHDTAKVSGGSDPSGTVSFAVYGPGDATCQTNLVQGNSAYLNIPLSNGQASSPDFTTTQVGVYQFVATYSGDTHNMGVAGPCPDPTEQVVTAAVLSEISLPPTGSIPLFLILIGLPLMVIGFALRLAGRRRGRSA